MSKLGFVRGNQNRFIRLWLEEDDLDVYEFQMCTHNTMRKLLPFQKRTQNEQAFLYYEMSGMQSLDVYLQTKRLDRSFFVILAKELLDLCRELGEYMLSIDGVVLEPKYIMCNVAEEELRFVYTFQTTEPFNARLETLLEFCIEYLDYNDKELCEYVFLLYDRLQSEGEHFALEKELKQFWENFTQKETIEEPFDEQEAIPDIFATYKRQKKRLLVLLCIDVIAIFLWKPVTLLKLFFFCSFGVLFFCLYLYVRKQESSEARNIEQKKREDVYLREYENIVACSDDSEDCTQFITIEHMDGMLYNLQGISPQYISIHEKSQLVGKERGKVDICILAEGISRVHAKLVKKEHACIIEDLCSTNGTHINGKALEPRVPYTLEEGDRVCFAGVEYIFK